MKGNGVAAPIRALFQTHFPLAFWAGRRTCHRPTSAPPTPGRPVAARRETRRPSSKPSSSGGAREKMARPGSAMYAIRARGRHHLWTCAPSNQKIHDMSILCQYFAICMDITRHIKPVFGWCRPLRPSPWPRHALIPPASLFRKSTRGGKNVCACVENCNPRQQADRKTTRPRKQCHLTCAGPLHGKVHCEAKKQKDCLKLGG